MYKKVTILIALLAISFNAKALNAPKAKESNPQVVHITLTQDNALPFNDEYDEDTTGAAIKQAKDLDSRLSSKDPIHLVQESPGGLIDEGLKMQAALNSLNRPVDTITIFAASMGFQTVQALGKRYILKNGTLMSHKAKGGFYGEFPGQLDSRYSYYLKRVTRMNEQAVTRTNGKHTMESYNNLIENEYWCDGQDCIDQGFADQLVEVSCDKSLDGTREKHLKFFFMDAAVVVTLIYDKCPMNTALLDYKVEVDGKDLYSANSDNNFYNYITNTPGTSNPVDKRILSMINDKVQELISRTVSKEVIKY